MEGTVSVCARDPAVATGHPNGLKKMCPPEFPHQKLGFPASRGLPRGRQKTNQNKTETAAVTN